MRKVKIIILVFGVIALVVFLFFYLTFPAQNADIQYKVIELSSKDSQSKLYIKKKVWGMTSDNQVVIISNSNTEAFITNVKENYIYEGLMPLFYKLQEDTLTIYTLKTSFVPKELHTRYKIIQVELTNPDMMGLIENDSYKKKGLIKID